MATPSCSQANPEPRSIALPRMVQRLLANPGSHAIPTSYQPDLSKTSLLVADSGATDHMIPDRSAFISYRRVHGLRVRMGNKSHAPVLGKGSAIISLNGKKVLIRDCLHVPDLRNPLYSLRAHQRQRGCGFIGLHGHGVYVYFPNFVLEVDTSTDCHLRYQALGRACGLSEVDYVQPNVLMLLGITQHLTQPLLRLYRLLLCLPSLVIIPSNLLVRLLPNQTSILTNSSLNSEITQLAFTTCLGRS